MAASWKIASGMPTGARIDLQYPLKRLNIFPAWEHTRGAGGPVIGHVDTGLNLGQLGGAWVQEFTGKNITPWNVLNHTTDIYPYKVSSFDLYYHGNMTGSVLYGNARPDGNGITGVVPDATDIIHVKYAIGDGLDTPSQWTEAILWAWERGARVFSCSTYFYADDPAMRAACDMIAAGGGVIVVCAGNETWDLDGTPASAANRMGPLYPAAYDSVITVGSSTGTDEVWGLDWRNRMMSSTAGSAYGSLVDVVAPTGMMAILDPKETRLEYPIYNPWVAGTSSSVPYVAGIAHMVLTVNPALTFAQVKSIIMATTDKASPPYEWAFYPWFPATVGIPDAERAVLMAKSMLPQNAGVVFPCMRAHGSPPPETYGQMIVTYPLGAARTRLQDGVATTEINGAAGLEIGGYCNGQQVSEVEFWVDGTALYQGPPTSKWTNNLFTFDNYRTHFRELRVVARTPSGQQGSRTYASSTYGTTPNSLTFVSPWSPMTAALTSQSGSAATLGGVRDQRATVSISYPTVPWSFIGTPTTPFYLPAAFAQSTPASAPISGGAPSDAPTITGLTPNPVTVGTPFTVSLAAPGIAAAPVVSALAPNPVTVGTPVVVSISAAGPAPTVTAVTPNPVTVGTPVTVSIAA